MAELEGGVGGHRVGGRENESASKSAAANANMREKTYSSGVMLASIYHRVSTFEATRQLFRVDVPGSVRDAITHVLQDREKNTAIIRKFLLPRYYYSLVVRKLAQADPQRARFSSSCHKRPVTASRPFEDYEYLEEIQVYDFELLCNMFGYRALCPRAWHSRVFGYNDGGDALRGPAGGRYHIMATRSMPFKMKYNVQLQTMNIEFVYQRTIWVHDGEKIVERLFHDHQAPCSAPEGTFPDFPLFPEAAPAWMLQHLRLMVESEKSRVVHNATAPNVVDPIGKYKNIDGMMNQIWSRLSQTSQDPMVLADVFAAHKCFCEKLDSIIGTQVDQSAVTMAPEYVPIMTAPPTAAAEPVTQAPVHQDDVLEQSRGNNVGEFAQQYLDDAPMIPNHIRSEEEPLTFAELEHAAAVEASLYYEDIAAENQYESDKQGPGRRRTFTEMSEESVTLETTATSPASGYSHASDVEGEFSSPLKRAKIQTDAESFFEDWNPTSEASQRYTRDDAVAVFFFDSSTNKVYWKLGKHLNGVVSGGRDVWLWQEVPGTERLGWKKPKSPIQECYSKHCMLRLFPKLRVTQHISLSQRAYLDSAALIFQRNGRIDVSQLDSARSFGFDSTVAGPDGVVAL